MMPVYAQVAAFGQRTCTTIAATIDQTVYDELAELTLETLQDAYDEVGDAYADLDMEVDYAVRLSPSY